MGMMVHGLQDGAHGTHAHAIRRDPTRSWTTGNVSQSLSVSDSVTILFVLRR